MLTYQDLLAVGENEADRADFVRRVIREHESSTLYQTARIADDYDRCRNTTTMQYQRMITDITGRSYVDQTATVHRSTSNFFSIFVAQQNQYSLGNGLRWNGDAGQKLGKDFDTRLQEAGHAALCGGVAFGFWNLDHLEVFPVYSRDKGAFAPLYDEENGGLSAGVRSWQIDTSKPERAVLYELDGYTQYMFAGSSGRKPDPAKWREIKSGVYVANKQPYTLTIQSSEADGETIYAGESYPSFPIVPLWANPQRQSILVGMREKIDAYDFVLNGWEDDLDNAQIYWIIRGAGGMDDPDLRNFLDRLRTVAAAAPAEGQDVQPVTVSIPVEARETLLTRLEKQLYRDAMLMNPENVASGAATATQIEASYEQQNIKADQYEACLLDFINGILAVAGIDDSCTFERSKIVNRTEEIQNVIQAAPHLSDEYVTRKIMTILGDVDQVEDVLRTMDADAVDRLGGLEDEDVTDNV